MMSGLFDSNAIFFVETDAINGINGTIITYCYGLIWIESKPEHNNRLIIAQLALLGGSELRETIFCLNPNEPPALTFIVYDN